ncbi:MAG TPA: hypothetical protein VMU95_18405 [Trebonia sp.]|nr:hypothetical protein [Trebonia sp.]
MQAKEPPTKERPPKEPTAQKLPTTEPPEKERPTKERPPGKRPAQELQRQQRGDELGQGGRRQQQAPGGRPRRRNDDRPDAQRGDQAVVGLGRQRQGRERVEQVGEHECPRERRPAQPLAEPVQAGQRQPVEAGRREQRPGHGGHRREDGGQRKVRVVRERAVGVRMGDAQPARTSPGRRTVQRLPVQQAPGPEQAGLPDIGDVARRDGRDPDGQQARDRQPQPARADRGVQPRHLPGAQAGPGHPEAQPGQAGGGQPQAGRRGIVAEQHGHREEARQGQQVQVLHSPRVAGVYQSDDEAGRPGHGDRQRVPGEQPADHGRVEPAAARRPETVPHRNTDGQCDQRPNDDDDQQARDRLT